MKRKIKIIITLLFITLVIISLYLKTFYQVDSFEQFLFTILNSKGTSYTAIIKPTIIIVILCIITLFIMLYVGKIYRKHIQDKYLLTIQIKNKTYKTAIFKKNKKIYILYYVLFYIALLFFCFKTLEIDTYIKTQLSKSNIFEEHFVVIDDKDLKFPEKKKNLVYIFVESLESTSVSSSNGGLVEKSYIPKLEKIAMDNINFSNTDKIGGALNVNGAGFTAGAMIAQTSGAPLKLNIGGNDYTGYSDSLPGLNSLGDILKRNGYSNYIMLGSDATFGGRRDYFKSHGDYKIMDYYYAVDKKWIKPDYFKWWGYEDKKLFEFAKKELKNISKEEPFNFTILTADTHFEDGYLDEDCPYVFANKYQNAFYCADLKIYDFLRWLKKQDFYKDTVVVIAGDHLTMQSNFYENQDYKRTIYNSFINTHLPEVDTKNRLFTNFDLFPTTLAAMNIEIKGNKIGFGTNLFSGEKTIVEELGYNYFNEEIPKKSVYYDNEFLKDTYYEMEKTLKNSQ